MLLQEDNIQCLDTHAYVIPSADYEICSYVLPPIVPPSVCCLGILFEPFLRRPFFSIHIQAVKGNPHCHIIACRRS
ncbi:hypothetical protein ABKN59_006147 [Abortiporus biennis]